MAACLSMASRAFSPTGKKSASWDAMNSYKEIATFCLSAGASALRGKRFLNCLWELTYRCTARCSYCSYWEHPSPPQLEMQLHQVKEGLDRIYAYGCRLVNFTGGEPTLRRDLEDIVRHASDLGMWTSIVTNGSTLTRARIQALKSAGLDNLLVSLDSLQPSVHDRQRGITGLFDRVVRSLEWLHEDFLTGHRTAGLMCVVSSLSAHSLRSIIEFAASRGVYLLVQPYHPNKTGRADYLPGPGQGLVAELLELKDEYGNLLNSRRYLRGIGEFLSEGPRRSCHAGKKYFSIDPYGYLHPCVDMPRVGHVLKDDISIVKSSTALAPVDHCRGCWYCFRGEADSTLSLGGYVEKLVLGWNIIQRNRANRPCAAPITSSLPVSP